MTAQVEALKAIFNELFVKLISFSLEEEFFEYLGESLEVFYNLQEGDEYEFDPAEELLFLSWLLLDDTDIDNYCLLDEFLNRHGDDLSLQEKQICAVLRDTNLTLLQVKKVNSGHSMVLRDVFLGEEFEVLETIGSQEVTAQTLLFTRVLPLGDLRFLVGAGIFLDQQLLEPLTFYMTGKYEQCCEQGHKISFKEFLKENAEMINWWIRAYEHGVILTPDSPDHDDPFGGDDDGGDDDGDDGGDDDGGDDGGDDDGDPFGNDGDNDDGDGNNGGDGGDDDDDGDGGDDDGMNIDPDRSTTH